MAGFTASTSVHINGVNAYQKKAAHHIPTAHVITEAEVSLQSPRGGKSCYREQAHPDMLPAQCLKMNLAKISLHK